PHLKLERRADGMQRQLEVLALAGEVFLQLHAGEFQWRGGADPARMRLLRMAFTFEPDLAQATAVRDQAQRADRAVHLVVVDRVRHAGHARVSGFLRRGARTGTGASDVPRHRWITAYARHG